MNRLAQYVPAKLNERRLEAQWASIAERLPRTPGRARRVAAYTLLAGVPVAATAVALTAVLPQPHQQAWAGSVVRSSETAVEIELGESERVEILPSSEIAFLPASDSSVGLSLEHGSTHLSFGDDAPRTFRVRTAHYEVVGQRGDVRVTRLVDRDGERLRVSVNEGAVEVRRTDHSEAEVLLSAGHHWSTFAAFAQVEKPQEATIEPAETLVAPTQTVREVNGGKRARRRAEELSAEAQELFDRANVARRGGQVREAEALYAEMVAKFARNRRTALAAFELGRIRMDSLADPQGAVSALEKALTLDGRGAFAEDALARLAVAYQASGDLAGCKRTRNKYRESYPDGVHIQNLERRCGGP